MKTSLICAAILALGVSGLAQEKQEKKKGPPRAPFTMKIPDFKEGGPLPIKFSCDNASRTGGGFPAGLSPHIMWTNTPRNTASFAVLMHTLEQHPEKSIYDITHWVIYNIPGTATELPEGVPFGDLPDGSRQMMNVRKFAGYYGPCAPPGSDHHFVFQLFALDTKLNLGPDANRADVEKAMDGHILASEVSVQIGRVH